MVVDHDGSEVASSQAACAAATVRRCAGWDLSPSIRVLVGSMVDVVQGKLDEAVFHDLLDGGDRREAGRTAPPQGRGQGRSVCDRRSVKPIRQRSRTTFRKTIVR